MPVHACKAESCVNIHKSSLSFWVTYTKASWPRGVLGAAPAASPGNRPELLPCFPLTSLSVFEMLNNNLCSHQEFPLQTNSTDVLQITLSWRRSAANKNQAVHKTHTKVPRINRCNFTYVRRIDYFSIIFI